MFVWRIPEPDFAGGSGATMDDPAPRIGLGSEHDVYVCDVLHESASELEVDGVPPSQHEL